MYELMSKNAGVVGVTAAVVGLIILLVRDEREDGRMTRLGVAKNEKGKLDITALNRRGRVLFDLVDFPLD